MTVEITKAVFPVAGLGSRFLPATKANPKEMLPIVDKPLIQYAVEEAVAVGIKELVFVTHHSKRAIEDHFDSNYELESRLLQHNKQHELQIVRDILPHDVTCVYVRQSEQLGLGHAILCAKDIIADAPFAVLLADDLIEYQEKSCLAQMMALYHKTNSSVIAVNEIAAKDSDKYGIVALAENSTMINKIVEKPQPKDAPSNLAAVGRYILTPQIFKYLAQVKPGIGGEIQLTDAIAAMLEKERVDICKFAGKRYDCGSKLGYLKATVNYGLKHSEVAQEFEKYLRERF